MNIYTVTIVLQTVFLRVKSRSDERWIVDGRGIVGEDGSVPLDGRILSSRRDRRDSGNVSNTRWMRLLRA